MQLTGSPRLSLGSATADPDKNPKLGRKKQMAKPSPNTSAGTFNNPRSVVALADRPISCHPSSFDLGGDDPAHRAPISPWMNAAPSASYRPAHYFSRNARANWSLTGFSK